jgi:hypothetical protein
MRSLPWRGWRRKFANVSVTEHGRAQATVEQLQARVEELELASAKAQVGVGVGSAREPDFSSPISASDLRLPARRLTRAV